MASTTPLLGRVKLGPVSVPWPVGDAARSAWLQYAIGMALLGILFAVIAQNPYYLTIFISTLIFAGLASAWNIIGGFGGQFSLGHGVFFAVGAYTVALLYKNIGLSPWLGLVPATVLAMIAAGIFSAPIFRLRGPFFAIATMALNQIALVLVNYSKFVGGPRGVTLGYLPNPANMIFEEPWQYGVLAFAFCAACVAAALAVRRSRLGYYLMAVREDEDSARAIGINAFSTKMYGMMISSGLTAIGGGIYGMFVLFIDPPSVFDLQEVGVRFPLLTLIGGVGTVSGPVVGALVIQPLASLLRGALTGFRPGTHLIVLAIIMILAALFMKRGIMGAVDDLLRRLRRAGER